MPHRPDLSVGNLLPAALGGVAAALVTSGFGIAGSLIGAALAPVAYLFVKEVTRNPTERVAHRAPRPAPRAEDRVSVGVASGDDDQPAVGPAPPEDPARPARAERDGPGREGTTKGQVRRYRRRRWRYLAATAALAFVIAVGAVTIPELITGSSLTTDRRTTFFGDAPASVSAPADPTDPAETDSPADGAAEPAPSEEEGVEEAPPASEEAPPASEETPEAAPADEDFGGDPLPAPESDAPVDPSVPQPAP